MTAVGVIAHSGKGPAAGLRWFRRRLAEEGVTEPLWHEVTKSRLAPPHVKELVEEGVDLLFVWGGDGMVQRTIDALRDAPVSLAILPVGTANLFASNLDVPKGLSDAVRVGLHGSRRTLDVGSVNGERFGVMAGTGLDAVMIRDAGAGLKDRLGRLAYVWTGIGGVGRTNVETTVEVNGLPWFEGTTSCVLVGNLGDVIGGMSAFPEADPTDGELDVGVVTAASALEWSRTLGRAIAGNIEGSPFVHTTKGESCTVRLARALPYELDGGDRDPIDRLKFKVKPAAISVCVAGEAA